MTDQLPPYTTHPQPEPEPPEYTLPETFTIGRNSTRHLVRPDQLSAHLQLLAAFNQLKLRVVASESLIAGLEADSEKRWVWFVNLAVERSVHPCLRLLALVTHGWSIAVSRDGACHLSRLIR
jgi:hypothetical protein